MDVATDRQRLQVLAAGICALILTVGLARFAYTPLLPIMRHEAGMSHLVGGWLATFNYLGYLTGVWVAASTSSLQRKFVLYRWGLVIALVSTVGMGMTTNVVLWAFLRYVSGFSSTGGMLLASGLVMNWLLRHRLRTELGLHFAGLGLGIVVSGIAVGLMVGHLAWDAQWLALGAFGLLFFVPAWRWMPPPKDLHVDTPELKAAAPSSTWMWIMVAAYCCAGVGYVISATFIVAILEKIPMLTGKGSWVWVLVGLAATPSTFVWDRVVRRYGEVGALLICYVLHTVSIAIPALTEAPIGNLVGAVLFGGTVVGIVSLTLSLIGRRFPANPAKAMARMTLSYGLAQIVSPAAAGFIATATGSYHGALIMATVSMLVGIALLVLALRLPAPASV